MNNKQNPVRKADVRKAIVNELLLSELLFKLQIDNHKSETIDSRLLKQLDLKFWLDFIDTNWLDLNFLDLIDYHSIIENINFDELLLVLFDSFPWADD